MSASEGRRGLFLDEHRAATVATLVAGGVAVLASFLTIAAALLPILFVQHSPVSAGEVLAAFVVFAFVVMALFAFVLQRLLRLKSEGSREQETLDIEIAEQS